MLDPEALYGATVALLNIRPRMAERLDEAAKVNPFAVDMILMPAFTEAVGERLSEVYRLTERLQGQHNDGMTVVGEYLPGKDVMYVRIGDKTYKLPLAMGTLEEVVTPNPGGAS